MEGMGGRRKGGKRKSIIGLGEPIDSDCFLDAHRNAGGRLERMAGTYRSNVGLRRFHHQFNAYTFFTFLFMPCVIFGWIHVVRVCISSIE